MNIFDKTNELLIRSFKVTPLGAQTFSKSVRYYVKGHAPMFIDHAEGCYLWDVDGNKFTDFMCALGPITLGYNYEKVNQAVIDQLKKGVLYSTQSPLEVELAEKLTKIIPCAEMVRFVKNGGDATTSAIRLARAFTGKERVAMCGYHGMHDWSIGASANNRGVPSAVRELTTLFSYNDLDSLEKVLEKHKNEFAAVILEPIQSNGTTTEYLQEVKNITHKNGALLIFDEVVSGFRYALGGASQLYNVVPDMAALGKGMANGMPLSAIVGRRDLLSQISDGVFISTTFGGDAISIAAALATINEIELNNVIDYFWVLGTKMLKGLSDLIKKYDINGAVTISGLAPHCGIVFNEIGSLSSLDINSVYSYFMIKNNILAFSINNISYSHKEEDIDDYLNAADKAFKAIGKVVKQDSIEGIIPVEGLINPIFKRNIK